MKLHVLQHAEGEGLGSLKEWFVQQGAQIKTTRVDLHEPFPKQDDIDWLIIMGGPMSAYEDDKYSWLKTEKEFIKEAIDQNKKVLGICLGGQLIASALGANVYANAEQEIGWYSILKTHDIATWLPKESQLLCWHGDCFTLPENATSFANSAITKHQGFCISPRVWALQFHIEAHEDTTETFFKVSGSRLPEGDYIQHLDSLFSSKHLYTSRKIAYKLLEFINSH